MGIQSKELTGELLEEVKKLLSEKYGYFNAVNITNGWDLQIGEKEPNLVFVNGSYDEETGNFDQNEYWDLDDLRGLN
jgi:hypothetical protein